MLIIIDTRLKACYNFHRSGLKCVSVAQWIEHLVADQKVAGSNPAGDARTGNYLPAISLTRETFEKIEPSLSTVKVGRGTSRLSVLGPMPIEQDRLTKQ